MKKRKVKKSVVKFILRIVSIVIIFYFFITTISYGIKIKTLSSKEKELNNNLLELKENEEKLKTDILKLNDKEYIARYAREHYLYTRDGEFALKFDEDNNEEVVKENKEDYRKIYIIVGGAFLILIIVFIKHKMSKKYFRTVKNI